MGPERKANGVTKLCLITELSNTGAAVPTVKQKDTFPGHGPRKGSTHKAVKNLSFGPSTLLQLLLTKDTSSNFDFWKSFLPVHI